MTPSLDETRTCRAERSDHQHDCASECQCLVPRGEHPEREARTRFIPHVIAVTRDDPKAIRAGRQRRVVRSPTRTHVLPRRVRAIETIAKLHSLWLRKACSRVVDLEGACSRLD